MNNIFAALLVIGLIVIVFILMFIAFYITFSLLFDKRAKIFLNPLSGWRRLKNSNGPEAKALMANNKIASEKLEKLLKGRLGKIYVVVTILALIFLGTGFIGTLIILGLPH